MEFCVERIPGIKFFNVPSEEVDTYLRNRFDIATDIFSLKVQKKSFLFSKHCILIMAASILINVGTLSKPNDCLSESSWKITILLVFLLYFNTKVEKSPIL